MNPRAAINDLHPFQGCPFGQLGYFSKMLEYKSDMMPQQSCCSINYIIRVKTKKQEFS